MVVQTKPETHPPQHARMNNAMKRLYMKAFRTPTRYRSKQPNMSQMPDLTTNYVDARYLRLCNSRLTYIDKRCAKPRTATDPTTAHFVIFQHKTKYVDLNKALFDTKRKNKEHVKCIQRWLQGKSPAMQMRIIDALVKHRAELVRLWYKPKPKPISNPFTIQHWTLSRARNELTIKKFMAYERVRGPRPATTVQQNDEYDSPSDTTGYTDSEPEYDDTYYDEYYTEVVIPYQVEELANRDHTTILQENPAQYEGVQVEVQHQDAPEMLAATLNGLNDMADQIMLCITIILAAIHWLKDEPALAVTQLMCIVSIICIQVCINRTFDYLRRRMN